MIAARDVSSIAPDDCVLFLWATVPVIEAALSDVLRRSATTRWLNGRMLREAYGSGRPL